MDMELGLAGRGALVLGAGGGLGGQVALDLAAEGARVAAVDRSPEALAALTDRVKQRGGVVEPVVADLFEVGTMGEVHQEVVNRVGPVEVLFNNSGGPRPAGALEVSEASWLELFQSMVLSIIRLTGQVVPSMRRNGWGRIITSTSSGVVSPISGLAASNTLRSALVGWSKTLAGEVAADGITANVIVPGRIATDRVRELDRLRAERASVPIEDVERRSTAAIPAGRYGSVEEYSAAVLFLASGRASFVNGAQLRVDGGMIASV